MKKKNLSRLVALTMSVLLVLCALPLAASAEAAGFEEGISWDAEYDVVVIGYGAAGAAAGAGSVEAGAQRVLITEKAPYGEEGGNSRYAAQLILCPKDRATALTYYKNLRGKYDNQTDEIIEGLVDGLMSSAPWLEAHGATLKYRDFFEYPELEGYETAQVAMINGTSWDAGYYKFLQNVVDGYADKIDVWYDAPATRLIQDPATGIIHGVVIENGGTAYNVRAINGVVMACGGFENSDEMLESYCQLSDAHSKGARFNTGDGIKMAIDVGADLWHMSTLSGNDVNFVNPDTGIAASYGLTNANKSSYCTGFPSTSMIIVGGGGQRFMDETVMPRHGHIYNGGTWFTMQVPDNSWCIFDETARLYAPAYPTWSEGMVDEIAKGWVVKADTLEELAQLTGIAPESLLKTVATYNGFCETKIDLDFGANPGHVAEALQPLVTAPYYAFPVKATMTNTQGGAKRNVQCEVLDVWGKAIPHLFSAGEFGSFYTDIYNGGGNLSECLFTGVTAGANATKAKDDVSGASLLKKDALDLSPALTDFEAGENQYIGIGSGMGGDVVVCVTMDGKTIKGVEILKHNETAGISDTAIATLPQRIVDAGSAEVDSVTGATTTSKAIMSAVADALAQVK
ncbi:MAG: FAD-binding protein [Clostridia bacterium]